MMSMRNKLYHFVIFGKVNKKPLFSSFSFVFKQKFLHLLQQFLEFKVFLNNPINFQWLPLRDILFQTDIFTIETYFAFAAPT